MSHLGKVWGVWRHKESSFSSQTSKQNGSVGRQINEGLVEGDLKQCIVQSLSMPQGSHIIVKPTSHRWTIFWHRSPGLGDVSAHTMCCRIRSWCPLYYFANRSWEHAQKEPCLILPCCTPQAMFSSTHPGYSTCLPRFSDLSTPAEGPAMVSHVTRGFSHLLRDALNNTQPSFELILAKVTKNKQTNKQPRIVHYWKTTPPSFTYRLPKSFPPISAPSSSVGSFAICIRG